MSHYDSSMKPVILSHRNQVYKAALAEAEKKYGALLETCDEGTKCREEIEKSMKESMIKIWKNIMTTIKQTIDTSVSETRTLVDTRWEELVKCQVDKPCCQYSKTTWINNTIKISTKRKSVHEWTDKWFEFEKRR